MALAGPPKLVTIEFEILSGVDRKLVGSGQHRYVSESGGSYGISITQQLHTELPGQDEAWQLEVSGRVTRQGLSPDLFEVRGNLPERLMTLKDVSEKPLAVPGKTRRGLSLIHISPENRQYQGKCERPQWPGANYRAGGQPGIGQYG